MPMPRTRPLRFLHAAVMLALLAACPQVQAYMLDWNSVTWPAGSLSHTYTNVDGSGVDIRISVADPSAIITPYSGTASPFNGNSPLTGGQPAGADNNLFLYIQPNPNTEFITVTVEFLVTGTSTAAQVSGVSYVLFDVDKAGGGSWIDQVRHIQGENTVTGTGPLAASSVTPVNSSNTQVTGSGLGTVITGISEVPNNSSQANVTIGYGTTDVSLFRFDFGHSATSGTAPSGIGLSRVFFTPVPEAESWLAAAGLTGLAAIHTWRRRRTSPPVR